MVRVILCNYNYPAVLLYRASYAAASKLNDYLDRQAIARYH